jgi:hypothetical protein
MRPDLEVTTFEHSEMMFPVRTVARGGIVRSLPIATVPLKEVHFEAAGKQHDLFDYLALNRVAGLLVLWGGCKKHFNDDCGRGDGRLAMTELSPPRC